MRAGLRGCTHFFSATALDVCVQNVLKLAMTGESGNKRAGVLIPIPQYPLYTATIAEYNAYPVSGGTHFSVDRGGWGCGGSRSAFELIASPDLCRLYFIFVTVEYAS